MAGATAPHRGGVGAEALEPITALFTGLSWLLKGVLYLPSALPDWLAATGQTLPLITTGMPGTLRCAEALMRHR